MLQSYFRNNVLHLFSAAAWIALCFQNNRRLSRAGMLRLGRTIYPFIQAELFLPWTEDEFAERLNATIDVFIARRPAASGQRRRRRHPVARPRPDRRGVPPARDRATACSRRSSATSSPSPRWSRTARARCRPASWKRLCHLAAQRLSLLYAPAAPEFFDKSLFRGFIGKLRELKLVWLCPNGKLDFDERLNTWEKDAKLVLSRELRHTITKISPEAVSKVAAAAP